jgi:hypothetical protein
MAFLIAVPAVACSFFIYVLIEFWRDEHGFEAKASEYHTEPAFADARSIAEHFHQFREFAKGSRI